MSDTTAQQIDDGGHAFPIMWQEGSAMVAVPGMTLRDYFAGQAIAGIHAHPETVADIPVTNARIAYDQADAMIAARNGGSK